jgi:hypothetical protein
MMRDRERRDFAPLDGVHDFAELLACEIQSAANLVDPLDAGESACRAERLQRAALVRQIGFLCL